VLYEERELVDLGKKMKKNKVALDIVNFGHPENGPKLTALVNAVNSSSNSHMLDIQESYMNVTDTLLASAIISPEMDEVMGGVDVGAPGGQPSVQP